MSVTLLAVSHCRGLGDSDLLGNPPMRVGGSGAGLGEMELEFPSGGSAGRRSGEGGASGAPRAGASAGGAGASSAGGRGGFASDAGAQSEGGASGDGGSGESGSRFAEGGSPGTAGSGATGGSAPACLENTELCGAVCVDLNEDPQHCGDCAVSCGETLICEAGTCTCPEEQVLCNGERCADTRSDPDFCGDCGTRCEDGWFCSQGQCLRSPCDGLCENPTRVAKNIEQEEGFRMDNFARRAGCFEVTGYEPTETEPRIVCWGFGQGRKLWVNGVETPCVTNAGSPLPEPRAGGYCIRVASGPEDFAGILLPTR